MVNLDINVIMLIVKKSIIDFNLVHKIKVSYLIV